jgi:aerobic-type carbon monoxide dehydrogenase small subunit (CoxS/CutS family)
VPLEPEEMPAVVLVTLQVNGEPVSVAVPPNWTLLELLRYGAGLTGTKQGCDKGDCGTCTVRIDGEPQLACLTLAVEVRDRHVETVEGLGVGGEPHPLIEAFSRLGAAQCGFCTPGMLMSASAYIDNLALEENPVVSREVIAHALAGNLCRCTGYTKILQAVEEVAQGALNRQREIAESTGEDA